MDLANDRFSFDDVTIQLINDEANLETTISATGGDEQKRNVLLNEIQDMLRNTYPSLVPLPLSQENETSKFILDQSTANIPHDEVQIACSALMDMKAPQKLPEDSLLTKARAAMLEEFKNPRKRPPGTGHNR